jgi:hypothetical protein
VEMSALAASVRNAMNDSHNALLIFLLKGSVPNLVTHRSLRDAAADDADMSRYASACSTRCRTSNSAVLVHEHSSSVMECSVLAWSRSKLK